MLGKYMDSIRSKEKEAAEMIRGAREEAESLLEETARRGESRLDDVRAEIDEKRRGLISRARKEAEQLIDLRVKQAK